ncbi:MAG TPA: SusC/RagA family TonB-linked outer membrane protein, partial [Mariniphaga sp.]|nr:SusC/RagA family TonB-linked outer membrane protein [Mariniphaga sp.]
MAYSSATYSQNTKLSLELNNVTVREVIKTIESQSEFLFFFQEKHVDLNRKVSLKVKDKDLESILTQVFDGTNNVFFINDRQIVIGLTAPKAPAENDPKTIKREKLEIEQPSQREIKGKVNDENGQPLPGVTVLVKGTTIGTITNADGEFSLDIPLTAEALQFSFVGMKTQELTLQGRTTFEVEMAEDLVGMEEVVVVGYGTQKKSDITGSVASFNTEILQERPQTNIAQALQGTLPGVNVTTSSSGAEDNATLLIRGQNSITASNNPLIVLDGIPYSGNLSELNPNDISSMEVLKDASSTAIYGSRGANGVILITTKKGQSGKLTVSYNGYYSWDEIAHLPDMQDANDFWRDNWERTITNQLSRPTNTSSVRQQIDEAYIGDENSNTDLEAFMMGYPGKTWAQLKDEILAKYPEYVGDYETLLQIAADFAYPQGGRNTDWVDLATRMGHKQQHNISFAGGSDNTKYYVSAIYGKNEGIALGDDFQRMIYRVNLNFQLAKGVNYGT